MRNMDVPQGIVANRLGYPLRETWQSASAFGDASQMLGRYTDDQLTGLKNNLKQSTHRLTVGRKIGSALQFAPLITLGLGITGAFLKLSSTHTIFDAPLEAAWNGVANTYQGDVNFAELFPGGAGWQSAAFFAAIVTELGGLIVIREGFAQTERKRRGQLNTVGRERYYRQVAKPSEEQIAAS